MADYPATPDELKAWYTQAIPTTIQWGGPGGWSGRCLSPLRPEKNPSFAVCCDPERAGFLDRATGQHGGVLELARLLGVDPPGEDGQADPEALAKTEAGRQRAVLEAARAAVAMRKTWDEGKVLVSPHAYLTRKGLPVLPGLKVDGTGNLLVPLHDEHGGLAGVQRIGTDGSKRLIKGSALTGSFHPLTEDWKNPRHETIFVTEGLSTGASLASLVEGPVLVAFSASNVSGICSLVRRCRPNVAIYAATDTDKAGRGAAEAAAKESGAVPLIPEGTPGTDWNDVLQAVGPEAAREELQAAKGRGETMAAEILRLQQAGVPAVDQGDDWGGLEVGPPIPLRPLPADPADDDFPDDLPPAAAAAVVAALPEIPKPGTANPLDLLRAPSPETAKPVDRVWLFPRGHLSIVAADPGLGKSMLMAAAAADLSVGLPVCGGRAEAPRRVLYLNGEAGRSLFDTRFRLGQWRFDPDRLKAVHLEDAETAGVPLDLDSTGGKETLRLLVEAHRPDLLVVDSLVAFSGADQNDGQVMVSIARDLRALAHEKGVAVCLVHHFRKRGLRDRGTALDLNEIQGSNGLLKLAALVVGIEPREIEGAGGEKETFRLIRPLKTWDRPFPDFGFRLEETEGPQGEDGFRLVFDYDPPTSDTGKSAAWQKVLRAFGTGTPFYRAAVESVCGVSDGTARRYLREWVAAGRVLKGGSSKATEYRVRGTLPGQDFPDPLPSDRQERFLSNTKNLCRSGGDRQATGKAERPQDRPEKGPGFSSSRPLAGQDAGLAGQGGDRHGSLVSQGKPLLPVDVREGDRQTGNRPDPSSPMARAATAAPTKDPTAGTPPTLDRAPAPPPKAQVPAPWGRPQEIGSIPDDEAGLLRWLKGGAA